MIRFKKDDGSDYPEWEEKTLGKVFSCLEYGMNAAATEYDGENKYIRITDIDEETHKYLCDDIVSPSGKLEDKYLLKLGDIVFARTGASVGKTYIYNEKDGKLYYAGFLIRGSTKNNYYAKYIFYNTLTAKYKRWVNIMSVRSGQPGINSNEYASFKFYCSTDYEEQQKIADFLSSVDEVISASEKEVANLKEQKKGVMQKIFSREVRFKADDGSDYPEWEEKTVRTVFKFKNGKGHEQNVVDNGEFIIVNSKFISTEGNVKKYSNEQILPLYKNDITMVMSDLPNGKALAKCFLIDNDNKYTLNQRICCLQSQENAFFMSNQLSRNSYFLKFDDGFQQTNLKKDDVLNCPIYIPIMEEQQKIANFLSDFDTAIEKAKAELECWKEIKKGLLQQLFEQ